MIALCIAIFIVLAVFFIYIVSKGAKKSRGHKEIQKKEEEVKIVFPDGRKDDTMESSGKEPERPRLGFV